jgi:hypothetical protein
VGVRLRKLFLLPCCFSSVSVTAVDNLVSKKVDVLYRGHIAQQVGHQGSSILVAASTLPQTHAVRSRSREDKENDRRLAVILEWLKETKRSVKHTGLSLGRDCDEIRAPYTAKHTELLNPNESAEGGTPQ